MSLNPGLGCGKTLTCGARGTPVAPGRTWRRLTAATRTGPLAAALASLPRLDPHPPLRKA